MYQPEEESSNAEEQLASNRVDWINGSERAAQVVALFFEHYRYPIWSKKT